jgi:DNA-binding NtrC family response regulator
MNPAIASDGMLEGRFVRRPETGVNRVPGRPPILIASLDTEIRSGLAQVLPQFPINTVWVKNVEDARCVLNNMQVAACFCEIWLQGGTCRELIWHVRRKSDELPIIIVSDSASSNEYCEWLAAMKMKALHFLTHPYKASDLEKFVQLAISTHSRRARWQSSFPNPNSR